MAEVKYPIDKCYFCQKKLGNLAKFYYFCPDKKGCSKSYNYRVMYDLITGDVNYISFFIENYEFVFYYRGADLSYSKKFNGKMILATYNNKYEQPIEEIIINSHLQITLTNYINIINKIRYLSIFK